MKYAIFIRHGESESNVLTILASRNESYHLTNKGISQVKRTASQLHDLDIKSMYTSPVTRARDTGDIIAKELNLKPEVREEIRETDFGKSEGKLFPGKISELTDEERGDMGIESWSSHVNRMRSFFSGLRENSVIVSHGFLIKAFVSDLLQLNSDESYGLTIRFASITIVTIPDGKLLTIGSVVLSKELKEILGNKSGKHTGDF